MVNRGARKFVFIGRTATDRLSARLLVDQLQAARAEVQVVRGDVGVLADVQKAVDLIKGPIGGVVQAAMGLDVSSSRTRQLTNSFADDHLGGSLDQHVRGELAHRH